ncbi:hypothetical protein [Pseudomonas trivialis]|uniref:hypothetical protein n=1 Tax=Pseudomonas trivialis TaxID=200450 RepID=UPI001112F1DE|nr:hypothetical protein [Pseudomonas trivialis]
MAILRQCLSPSTKAISTTGNFRPEDFSRLEGMGWMNGASVRRSRDERVSALEVRKPQNSFCDFPIFTDRQFLADFCQSWLTKIELRFYLDNHIITANKRSAHLWLRGAYGVLRLFHGADSHHGSAGWMGSSGKPKHGKQAISYRSEI